MRSRIRSVSGVVLAVASLSLAPAAIAAIGGPDAAFYTWADSDEPGITSARPSLNATDIRTAGFSGDDTVLSILLPTPFPYYGQSYNRLWVSSNGWISFSDPMGDSFPKSATVPKGTAPNTLVAMLWDDWTLEGNSAAAIAGPTSAGDGYGVAFNVYAKSDPVNHVTVFTTLYWNGAIKVGYYDFQVPLVSGSTSAGIEDANGTVGLPYITGGTASNGASFRANYAVEYFPRPKLDCGAATAIACGASGSYSNLTGVNNVSRYSCSAGAFDGNEAVFALTLPRFTDLTATLGNTGGRNLSLLLLPATCNEVQGCLAQGTPSIAKTFVAPGRYYLVVDGQTQADDGPFTLDVQCADSIPTVACNTTLRSEATFGGTNRVSTWPCAGMTALAGPEKYYQVDVPPLVTLRTTLANPSDPTLQPLISQGTGFTFNNPTCLATGAGTASLYGPPAGVYLITVDEAASPGGSYDLGVQCIRNLACPSPARTISLSPPTPVSGDTTGKPSLVSEYYCASSGVGPPGLTTGFTGPEDVYEFTVTSPSIVTFLLDNPDLRLLILKDCYEGSCVMEGGCGENLEPGTYRLVVDGRNGAAGAYTITPVVLPAAPYNRWYTCPECARSCPAGQDAGLPSAKSFHFNSGNFCGTGCDFSLFAVVECGTELHIPFFDVETGHMRIYDVLKQAYVDLSARNDSTTCPYSASGQQVDWEDQGCPSIPCPGPGLGCDVPPSGKDCRTSDTTIDVSFQGTPGTCGVFRLDFLDWGGFKWDVYANCTGEAKEQWTLYRDLCSALASYRPRPEVGIVAVDVDNLRCAQQTASGTLTVENIGCAPVAGFEIGIREEPPGTGLPETLTVDLAAGERKSIPWSYAMTLATADLTFGIDPNDRTPECSEAAGGAVACAASGGLVRTIAASACTAACQTAADAGPDQELCQGSAALLDGSASTLACVTGGTSQYRWEDTGGNPLPGCDWGGPAACPVAPAALPVGSHTFTLRARCLGNTPACETADTVQVAVAVDPAPPALGNFLRAYRETVNVQLSWTTEPPRAVSAYRVFKDGDKQFPPALRALVAEGAAATATDPAAVSSPPGPVAYYQLVGVSCLGDLEGPY